MASHLAKLGNDRRGAEVQREAAPILDRVDADDGTDAAGVQRCHGEQPDRAETDHDHRVARVQARALHSVDGHREGLHKARVLEREPRGEPMEKRRRAPPPNSANPPSRAKPMPAVSAMAQRYAAPLRQSSHTPHGILGSTTAASPTLQPVTPRRWREDAGKLVARDGVGEQPDLVRGQVRAADAAPVDADDDLPWRSPREPGSRRARGGVRRRVRPLARLHQPELRNHPEQFGDDRRVGPHVDDAADAARRGIDRSPVASSSRCFTRSPWPPSASARRS